MAITVKDVAKLAGVSPSTVSRVCNNNPAISPETRERVKNAMDTLGYELPPEAPALQAIRNIGVILPPSDQETYENTFYLKALRGISQVCNQHQVASTVITGRDYGEILSSVQILHRSGGIDGFIVLYSRKNDSVQEYLCEKGILYVIVGKAVDMPGQTVCVDNDNLLAGQEAADYLYRLGHRRIGFIGTRNGFLYAADRQMGWQVSALQKGLPLRPDYALELSGVHPEDAGALEDLLRREDRPTAFVVSDDLLALGLERCCARLGLSIPEDISIIAFNNSLYARMAAPRLTVVDINSYRLGQEAAIQLLRHAENPNLSAARILVPHRIVEGDSCREL